MKLPIRLGFGIAALSCVAAALCVTVNGAPAQVHVRTKVERYVPPRPFFGGLHVGMPEDSALAVMRRIAARRQTLMSDTITLVESDSVRIFGQAAYIQLQIVQHRVRTIVINWHPLGGDGYTNLRDQLNSYMEAAFGRGIIFTNGSLSYHRWETEDGTSEVSHSDNYFRIFVRLGKPRE